MLNRRLSKSSQQQNKFIQISTTFIKETVNVIIVSTLFSWNLSFCLLTTAAVLNFEILNADLFFTDKICDIE